MEYGEIAGSVEKNDEGTYQGRGEATGVRIFLERRSVVGVTIWCGYLVGDPPHGTVPRGISVPGGPAADEAAPAAAVR